MTESFAPLTEEGLVETLVQAMGACRLERGVCIDLRERQALADWLLLADCRSEVQLQSAIAGIRRHLRRAGVHALREEAFPGSRWGVLDYGTVIVHVFLPEARQFYSLERLWSDAPQKVLDLGAVEPLASDRPAPKRDAADSWEDAWV